MKKGTVGFVLSIIGVCMAVLGTIIGSVIMSIMKGLVDEKSIIIFLIVMNIIALIINIVAFVLCNSEMKNNNKGIAKAGFIISIIGLSIFLGEILLMLSSYVLILLFTASFAGSSL